MDIPTNFKPAAVASAPAEVAELSARREDVFAAIGRIYITTFPVCTGTDAYEASCAIEELRKELAAIEADLREEVASYLI